MAITRGNSRRRSARAHGQNTTAPREVQNTNNNSTSLSDEETCIFASEARDNMPISCRLETGNQKLNIYNMQVEEVHEECRYGFIYSGYRGPMSAAKALLSIFKLHNETFNIWTHLLPFLVSVPIMVYIFTVLLEPHGATKWEVALFVLAAIGVESVFLCSSIYHTMGCVSSKCSNFYSKFDYTAIAVKITCGGTPILYTAFYCEPHLQLIYIGMSYVLGTLVVATMCNDKFAHPRYLSFRVGLFIGLGATFIVPVAHLSLFTPGFDLSILKELLVMGAVFVIGALIYAYHLPERWMPRLASRRRRWIDHIGHSHGIFHICVVYGGYILVTIPYRMFADLATKDFVCY